jgi:Ni,Fe-hydrogenase III small subunit
MSGDASPLRKLGKDNRIFRKSISVRVVSTGCSACDLELSACSNPVFDLERFGIHVVASPRFADVLLVTGPVPKAMHAPLKSCFEAMAEPRIVMAVGTCAISGGVHKNGYAEANGVTPILPVDIFVPGCPPHPWSIVDGLKLAMSGADR